MTGAFVAGGLSLLLLLSCSSEKPSAPSKFQSKGEPANSSSERATEIQTKPDIAITMSVGFSWGRVVEEAMVAAVFVLPLAALLFLGLPKWRYGCALLLAVVLPVFVAEVWAGVEEMRFKHAHRGEKTGPTSRAVFENNWIAYDAATGKLSGGD